ncbi:hypothetical protein COO91_10497 (plasmid) [Nostoc flagelliforme CCNUN1]|uniref:Helix-turn-helix domain-containing protein n=1 Tax=Nostoc flagelliforme CCNUN1 TaxID=2038116 RepID=A0A2K8T9A2_9NOSO|nr:hypothetical protein [Nostoc flagelliforme]AUB44274.1 hypothetical protein COO91_10497 [Nostoc flagelliforme CCNUN1]
MHTKWTDEELGIIEAKAELYTPKQIASILKRHGYFRTPIAIATKLWALGYSTSPFLDNYSSAEIARVLCVHSTTVSGWVRRGWLKTSRRSSKRYQVRRWHLKQFFDNPPQHLKKRIASIDSEAINYLLGKQA